MGLAKIESLEDLLFQLQTYEDEDSQSYPQLVHLIPQSDQIFDIDLDTRIVNIPQFLSVQYDHNAEVIYFRCPRYFDNMDLASCVCIIEYINADGEAGLYWVPYYNVDVYQDNDESLTPLMLIPWSVGGLATASSGTLTFSVRFYQLDATRKTFVFNMSTRPTQGEILHGIDLSEEDLQKFKLDTTVTHQIYADLQKIKDDCTVYWTDV